MGTISLEEKVRFKRYVVKDFGFLDNYITEFSGRVSIKLDETLNVFYDNYHVASIILLTPGFKKRLYTILFHPKFTKLPVDSNQMPPNPNNLYPDFKTLSNDYAVTVGIELASWWCNKLIGDAHKVIRYKSLH